jgi:hypothetical protein
LHLFPWVDTLVHVSYLFHLCIRELLALGSPENLARGKWVGPHDLARHENDPARQVTGPGQLEARARPDQARW